jgi:hypothetical protein
VSSVPLKSDDNKCCSVDMKVASGDR